MANNVKKEGEVTMNACALKPTMPFVAKSELKRTPATEENKRMVEFIDSHNFSFSVDKESKKITNYVTLKK
jgi:hypothetical protein